MFNKLNSILINRHNCLLFFGLLGLSTSVHATDYTRMAQDMVAASKRDTKTQERSVKDFLQKVPVKNAKAKQAHQDFEFYLHPDSSESSQGKTCRKGQLRPVDASKLSQPLLGADDLSSTGKSDQRSVDDSQLLIFVSLGLPDAVLKALHEQAIRYGGRLVIRGLLQNSFQKTQMRLRDLGITVDIHPVWFETFDVNRVPTFVLRHQNGEDTPRFDKVSGNVPVESALQVFARDGSLSQEAKRLLQKGESL